MRKNNLAFHSLLKSLLALWVVLSQGDNMRHCFGETAGFLSTHGHNSSNDCIFVAHRNIRSGDRNTGKYEPWIRSEWSHGIQLVLKQRGRDPGWRHNIDHTLICAVILGEICGFGNNVGDSVNPNTPICLRIQDNAAIFLKGCGQLSLSVQPVVREARRHYKPHKHALRKALCSEQ
jgi:hypothetical protein